MRVIVSSCPFCGSEKCSIYSTAGIAGFFYVECIDCEAQSGLVDTPQLASKKWNARKESKENHEV